MLTVPLSPAQLIEDVISELSAIDQDLVGYVMTGDPIYTDILRRYGLNKIGFAAAREAALSHMREALWSRGIGSEADLV